MLSLNELIVACVFLPLFGALVSGLFVRNISDKRAQLITCVPMVFSALFAVIIFGRITEHETIRTVPIMSWIESGDFVTHWALKVDVLTAVMLLLVTWVAAIVHIYSVGYMSHDEHKPRFMSYLSLFTFSMLMLVTSDNFIQLFFGWGGGRAMLVPAHRLLVQKTKRLCGGNEGVHRQPCRRFWLCARHRGGVSHLWLGRFRDGVQGGQ